MVKITCDYCREHDSHNSIMYTLKVNGCEETLSYDNTHICMHCLQLLTKTRNKEAMQVKRRNDNAKKSIVNRFRNAFRNFHR